MSVGSKSRVGVGLLLIIVGAINLATWQNARLANPMEVATFFFVSIAFVVAGLWFCFRGLRRKG